MDRARMTPTLQALASLPPEKRAQVVAKLSSEDVASLLILTEQLADFVPRITPHYQAPLHLAPLLERLEASQHQEIRAVIHAPPRHVKTDTILNAFAWLLGKAPERTHAFVTYSADLSRSKSRKARTLAKTAGVQIAGDAKSLSEWRTTSGGGLLATGVGGPLTGQGVTGLLVVDDPVKNRVEAESEATRESVWEWFNDVAYTRLEPGASCLVVMTRWHPQDLAGKLIEEKGWEYIKLPAIDGDGKALWPGQFSVERLEAIREQLGEYSFSSLYQGEPRSRGGQVFSDVRTYNELPTSGFRVSLGVDCAYTKKKTSDYSTIITLIEHGGLFYVADVQRLQVAVPVFKTRIDAVKARHTKPRTRWYTSTTEAGLADMLGVFPKLAKEDKFVRAQPVAAAWNAGKVLVPTHAPWLDAFLAEVLGFTGVNDDHDDQVDGLAAAYDEFVEPAASYSGVPKTRMPTRRM